MVSRVPFFQTVFRRLVPGSGPRSRSITRGAAATGRSAASSVRRSSGRLVIWLVSAPSMNVSANAARSAGSDASGCRSSVTSAGGMMYRTQMTMPMPMARKATDIAVPRARLDRSVASTTSPFLVPISSPT